MLPFARLSGSALYAHGRREHQNVLIVFMIFGLAAAQVVQGLIRVVAVSLANLNQQMSQAYIVKQQLPPMLELEMHLAGGKVSAQYIRVLYLYASTTSKK